MEQYYIHAIYVYLIINFLIFGVQIGEDNGKWRVEDKGLFILFIQGFLMIPFGLIIFLIFKSHILYTMIRDWLNTMFQIEFWFEFYFTLKQEDLSVSKLQAYNKKTEEVFNKDTFSHRMFKRCVKALNKRHSFIYFKQEDKSINF